MSAPVLNFEDRATRIAIDMALTREGKLNLCLLQLPANLPAIENDDARPQAVAAMEHLLAGGGDHALPALHELIPGGEPVLIVAPEFAFAAADWTALNAAIRQSARPLIVFVGFGACPGGTLLDWATAPAGDGDTRRQLAWDQAGAHAIGTVRPVNAAWCWVHRPGEQTYCFVILKNEAEQAVEAVQLAHLQYGRTVTHLRFDDVDLFPMICADLLPLTADHPDSPQRRVGEVLAPIDANRPALVVGALLQHGYNVNWQLAIDALLGQVMAGRRGLVALCNIAHDRPVADELADRWRSLSGVYGRFQLMAKGQKHLRVTRTFLDNAVAGAVMRHTAPMVASGTIDWGPYGPTDGRFFWHGEMQCPIAADGLQAPVALPPPHHGCELVRFLKRNPPHAGWSPRVKQGATRIAAHIQANATPCGDRILTMLLNGVSHQVIDPDALHALPVAVAATAGLHALAALASFEGVEWQSEPTQYGHFRLATGERNILLWRAPDLSPGQMRASLSRWLLDTAPHPELIVIGQSAHGDLPTGSLTMKRRDDITVQPAATGVLGGDDAELGRDLTGSRGTRRATAISLAMLSAIYTDYTDADTEQAQIDALLAAITNATGAAA